MWLTKLGVKCYGDNKMLIRIDWKCCRAVGIHLVTFPNSVKRFHRQRKEYQFVYSEDLNDFLSRVKRSKVSAWCNKNDAFYYNSDSREVIFMVPGKHKCIKKILKSFVLSDYTWKGRQHLAKHW